MNNAVKVSEDDNSTKNVIKRCFCCAIFIAAGLGIIFTFVMLIIKPVSTSTLEALLSNPKALLPF